MFAKRVIIHQLVSALVLQAALVVQATDILQGDSDVAGQSFKQPIKEFCQGTQGRLYVGAHAVGAQQYAVAVAPNNAPKFFPIAPPKVYTPGGAETDNPLHNANITHMGMMYGVDMASLVGGTLDRVIAVTQAEPANIYLIDSVMPNRIEQLALSGVKDASGSDVTQGIIEVTSDNPFWIFGAVLDSAQAKFGLGNSGVALVAREQSAANADNSQPSLIRLRQIDARLGKPPTNDLTRAALLNNQSPSISIHAPTTLTILNNAVDVHWNSDVGCLFTALSVQATGNPNDGAQAIVLGRIISDAADNNMPKLVFIPITLASLFTIANNNIVGAIGPDVTISIHKALSLYTSTVVNYLVVLGGVVGTPDTTKRTVYALPIVKNQNNPQYNGMLASKNALPVTFYHSGCPERVANRGFIQPATTSGELFTASDETVIVGHGPMTEGDITSIMAYGDAVYAVVSETYDAAHRPGIFYSQALFDSFGRIKCWTNWARVSGNFYDQCYGAMLDRISGNLSLLIGADAGSVQTVKRTTWSSGSEQGMQNLVTWLNGIFNGQNGGIQGLSDVPYGTPGLNDISLLVAVGLDHVALAQTGSFNGTTLIPLGGTTIAVNPQRYTNGTINTSLPVNTNAIEISGGELQGLGALTSSAISRVGGNGYLFVGGISGLAILTNAAGYSWDATGLGDNLTGLTPGLSFKKIGAFSQIRKLIADPINGLLYVLSDSQFTRIDIHNSNFITGDLKTTTLADIGKPPFNSKDTLLDAIASQWLCLLGTSKGLYINGPTTDVAQAQSIENMQWQAYNLPEQLCSAQQLFGVSVDYTMSGLTTGTGGNIYLLDTQPSKNRAVAYRLTINTQTGVPGVPYSVEMFPDLFIKDRGSYFVAFNGYRDWIYTNGAIFFECLDRTLCMDPLLALLSARVRTAVRFGGASHEVVPINLSSANVVQPLIRSSASGALLLAQNNVLSVNE